jgi:hypothetical protein
MTFRIPRTAIAVWLAVMIVPEALLVAYLAWRHPELRTVRLFGVLAGAEARRSIPWLVGALLLFLYRFPVVVDSEGIRFAWFHRLKWSEVTGARIRTVLGIRVLEISRRSGRPWQPILYLCSGLPAFLAQHAPDGNPLRLVREVADEHAPS